MGITRQDIEKVALLARLQLTDAEVAKMSEELAQIVGYVDQLAEVDTEGVEPMAHAIESAERVSRTIALTRVFRATRRSPTRRITMPRDIWFRPFWVNELNPVFSCRSSSQTAMSSLLPLALEAARDFVGRADAGVSGPHSRGR